MKQQALKFGGLDCLVIEPPQAQADVVMLHGRNMRAADLAPFAHSLGLPARFIFPDAPLPAASVGTKLVAHRCRGPGPGRAGPTVGPVPV